MHRTLYFAAAAAVVCTSFAQAQVLAGLGRQGPVSIDIDTPTGQAGSLGVEYVNFGGSIGAEIFVTARYDSTGAENKTVFVFDTAGNLLRSFPQSANSATTTWGWRDLASDGTFLLVGSDNGIEVIDRTGAPSGTFNGQAVATPIPNPGTLAVSRALAFDPQGNAGSGSIFVADFGSSVYEISLSGAVLHTYPNTSSLIWSAYGMAWDAVAGTLWVNSAPNNGDLVEYSVNRGTNTMAPTGRVIPRAFFGSAQGGLDLVPGGLDGRGCGYDLLGLDQAGPDTVTAYRVDLWNNYPSQLEAVLDLGKNGGPRSASPLQLYPTDTSFEIGHTGAAPGTPYIGLLDVAGTYDPVGTYAALPGLKALWELREFGSAPIQFNGVAGTPISIPVSSIATVALGQTFSLQSVVVDTNLLMVPANCGLGLPLLPTNVAEIDWVGPPKILVTADGTNNWTSPGFWQVAALPGLGGDSIVEITFDFFASTNTAQADMVFDIDQTGMGGVTNAAFWNGNATGATCIGTYAGTDLITGLDYTAPQINRVSTCAVGAENSGCEVNNAQAATGTAANNVKTLTWRYTPGGFVAGETFIMDCDTDLGAGVRGGDMAGMVVTITTQGGQVYTGELAAVSLTRSELQF